MGKNIYKTLLTAITVIAVAFAFIILGNIITIGDKIGTMTHPYVEHVFYITILLLTVWFVFIPVCKVLNTPSLPALEIDDCASPEKVMKMSKLLIGSCTYIEDEKEQREHRNNLKQEITKKSSDINELKNVLKTELDTRFNLAKKEIYKSASGAFASTAISQNSTIDTLSVLMINCKLIHKIIQLSGFRPNIEQLARIYTNVIFSAFFAHISQAGTEQSASMIVNKFIKGLKSIPFGEAFAGSILDGTVNALMTLRVGFLTISYLKAGAQGSISENDKRSSTVEAIRSLPNVIGEKAKAILNFITRFSSNNSN